MSIYSFLEDHRNLPLEDEITATLISPSSKSSRTKTNKVLTNKKPNSLANTLILNQTQEQNSKKKMYYCEFLNIILDA